MRRRPPGLSPANPTDGRIRLYPLGIQKSPKKQARLLDRSAEDDYSFAMNDTPHHGHATAAEWAAILAESEAEAEAGLFVPGDEIMRELRESIARMESRVASADRTGAVPGSPPCR
jgi:predicted transcriptional regulator